MDLQDIRTLNLVGTILFFILGCIFIGPNMVGFGFALLFSADETLYICLIISILIIIGFILLTYVFYIKTVVALDRGEYDIVKRWMLIGAIFGLFAGVIPFLLFLVSYLSFDDALRPKQYFYPPYPYPPPGFFPPYGYPPQPGYYPPQGYQQPMGYYSPQGPQTNSSQHSPPEVKKNVSEAKYLCPNCGGQADRNWIYCANCNTKLR